MDSHDSEQPDRDEQSADRQPLAVCPPFDPGRLSMQMTTEAMFRWTLIGALIIAIFFDWSPVGQTLGGGELLIFIVLGGGWIWLSINGSKAGRAIGQISGLLEQDLAAAESLLAGTIGRWPLPRMLRLLLYHRLAVIRHRQQRYAETASICDELLNYRLGGADPVAGRSRLGSFALGRSSASMTIGPVRSHLLLMLVESQLQIGNLWAAQEGLVQLHRGRLGLAESLQQMVLQIRYEITAGYPILALGQLDHKLQIAELLPAPAAGALHAMLSVAAGRTEQPRLATWLHRRAALLSTPDQLQAIGLPGAQDDGQQATGGQDAHKTARTSESPSA